jgi:hypothetical protein
MDLSKIVSVSGMPGLYHVLGQRADGLIIASFDGTVKKFVASRNHMFTPLENITIYTMDDSEELKNVFMEMKKQESANPPIDPSSSGSDLRDYFNKILPDHDPEKVYNSDIKKIIKWYHELKDAGLLKEEEKKKEEKPAKKEKKEAKGEAEEKPKKSKAKKSTKKEKGAE